MKEAKDGELLARYIREHGLDHVFPEPLLPYIGLYRFEPGEFVCRQGDPAGWLYVLVKGKIKIYTTSAEGKTLILSFKTPLDAIGDIEYVQGAEILNTVEAVSAGFVIGVPYARLRQHAGDHAPLLRFLLDIVSRKFFAKSLSLSFNLMHPVEVRLASYLLAVTFEEPDAPDGGRLGTSGLRDAANQIGTSYRHVNRVLGQFADEGLIERGRGFIAVKDRAGLRARAGRNIYE
ncbi:cyclic nucleotide-binding domain-containing protein [Paenibacillus sp. MWE-103]|uniref:Cyclic nucleotide-binding domain-containing protein n=1 Tax=Paenibacillus artemisiicola TaxID=1172618 RepID=A0ABS3W4Q8_9BACL|nr:cyclic nucleotide-binding domain-containing protein [Paenibacillus artemisiicola]MBO7743283.1 cyclic nucleotide-binding domain-containing protein [Paenibacillus artemisiicola]